ncbi:hypothetical protein AZE42_07874 [Rhizopogon vesiculosus]|uniref:Major facilitator superfamily (MFS) profile domain-containing protein n=1 Tax=Rhizopogon vesiculosus TaxID=180088 RepID=A0A1J8QDR5_9AGAM|nr:hypothetical protein AZE42_07874 [Rhizopogon vesiculosus]
MLFFSEETLSTKRRPKLASATLSVSSDAEREALAQKSMANVPLRSLLVPTTVIPIANYSILAFLDISLKVLFPLFFSTPIYLGGLGLTPSAIGSWMALSGIVDGLFQALFFAKIVGWLGPKRLFCVSVVLRTSRDYVSDNVATCTSKGNATAFMFIIGSAPAKNVLDAINGLGQTSAALARAFGPALATSLFAFSKEHNIPNGNALYVIFIIFACGLGLLASQLPHEMILGTSERGWHLSRDISPRNA